MPDEARLRAKGLSLPAPTSDDTPYDPNDAEAVAAFWDGARITLDGTPIGVAGRPGTRGTRKRPAKEVGKSMPKTIKTRSGRTLILPTAAETAAIDAGIAADPDTYELDDKEFAQLKRVGRARTAVTKERITIRLSPDVVQSFRASGDGWQTRIDAALRDWLKTHSPA